MGFFSELIEFIDYVKSFNGINFFYIRGKRMRDMRGRTNFFRNVIPTVTFQ